ncbi:MAG: undecaprenyl-diphosphate phosphatase [Verrucomicrobiota bacterium]|jgi:undecaprenyl-diphosphatase
MPDWISVLLLGLVEGITEFIPVSSTGHLLIAEQWLEKISRFEASEMFTVVIQLGAVLAVIPLFRQRFHQFIFEWNDPAVRDYLAKIVVAFFITGVGGFLITRAHWELKQNLKPIGVALLIGGILFLAVEYWLRGKPGKDVVGWNVAIAVGLGQILAAVFPGTSRSGATILLALILGLNRPLATEFSFLVSIPTMIAASGYEIHKTLRHPVVGAAPERWDMVCLGFVVSAIVSFIAVKWLLRYVQTHTFNAFGWYRIALAIGIFLVLFTSTGP